MSFCGALPKAGEQPFDIAYLLLMTHSPTRPGLSKVARVLCSMLGLVAFCQYAFSAGVVQFRTSVFEGNENDTATLTVVRTGDGTDAVSVVLNVGVAGTATFGTDFDIDLSRGTVDFADGELFRHIVVDLLDDADAEGTEFATLAVSSPSGGATLGIRDSTRLEIRDDETSDIIVSFSDVSLLRMVEGDSADIMVSKTGPSMSTITAEGNAIAGTATEAVDYTDPMAMLTFDAVLDQDQTFTLFTLEDDLLEGDEGLDLLLFLPDDSEAVVGELSRAVLIEDDEPNQPGRLTLDVTGGTSVSENVGTVSFTVNRVDGSSGAVAVDYVTVDAIVGNVATAGSDYVAATGTLSFADGQTSETFTIAIIDDTVANSSDRQFDVLLANPTGGATIEPDNGSITLFIQEDDGVPDDDDCVGLCDCFIATAAYGSYLDPHVDTLRAFRDEHLLDYEMGRAFVAWYYDVSPEIAAYIAEHESLRFTTRIMLTPVVYLIEYPGRGVLVLLGLVLLSTRRRWRVGT